MFPQSIASDKKYRPQKLRLVKHQPKSKLHVTRKVLQQQGYLMKQIKGKAIKRQCHWK